MSDDAQALPHDPSLPRAGDWPGPAGDAVDLALLGVPAWRTSLSPTGAHATPAAVRAALRRFSPALVPDRPLPDGGPSARVRPVASGGPAERTGPVDLAELTFADLGDVDEPDGAEGEARRARRSRPRWSALGCSSRWAATTP